MWKQALLAASVAGATTEPIRIPSAPNVDSVPGQSFISYSIELSSFPDFAGTLPPHSALSSQPSLTLVPGNKSNPNTFTDNLLTNIGNIAGSKPYIRVGGNTQDFALYNASLRTQINGTYDPQRSNDYPTTIYLGPSFFESYQTLPGVRFSHGFNLGKGAVSAEGWQALVDTAPLACKAFGRDRFYGYEYGNEPNNFNLGGKYRPRNTSWDAEDYVREWRNGTAEIRRQMRKHCPELEDKYLTFMAPSYDDRASSLPAVEVWKLGLDENNDINTYSVHNYIDGAASPGVTLQHTLMNHTRTTRDVDEQVRRYKNIVAAGKGTAPLIFGETNSLYNQGKPGLSNSFGAALWGLDFNLYSAAAGYQRVHMHQGTNYRYQSWQPVDTHKAPKGTKAPYYGNIAAASALSNLLSGNVSVTSLPLVSDAEAAYAIYEGGRLRRVLAINMRGYNTTKDGAGVNPLPAPKPRPSRPFFFAVGHVDRLATVQRLMANGSDAITGITYDGWSYNYELDNGKPVRLRNVTTGETLKVSGGVVTVHVPDSSAALLHIGD
ncbi:Glycoside hydrolase, catalytic core [Beauveria bassiana ARSEF 2860]|uniref:Glycoside hydrolase, catalytic core n=1 Tax=Beauveria bassiana (strain ARSEF 2860) TaxID=655819 RepID=J5JF48_BEAB2|nr:Glycoside hydrolase, catalytic core [Beauveria bassiana ARSEF 2860]EJP64443.1 Glycoside hydrolase, catalytic core [Beauveria bassiana ARSEF 2860]